MDLIQVLRTRIDALPPGEHLIGLRSVLQHVQVGASHLSRGVSQRDETAFTDAIYRTNQAFEGSLKEAYRVLAGKDPLKVRPFDIESYLQENTVMRARVLAQLSNYRIEWRNPSAHDYRLDFDEDEALLAIVSVCAFAIVLVDQIAEKLMFEATKATVPQGTAQVTKPLLDTLADVLQSFKFPTKTRTSDGRMRESEIVGALAGYLSSTLYGAVVDLEPRLSSAVRPDLLVRLGNETAIVEVKFDSLSYQRNIHSYLGQMFRFVAQTEVRNALLYVHPDTAVSPLIKEEHPLPGGEARVLDSPTVPIHLEVDSRTWCSVHGCLRRRASPANTGWT